MPPDVFTIALALALFAAVYAVLAGRKWLTSLIYDPRAAHRKGLLLNLLRRAAPPMIGGLILLVAGGVLGLAGSRALAALLIAGGLAYGLHRGLADLGQDSRKAMSFRVVLSLGLTFGILWLTGLP